jgi:uncharacterized glyoxalase superfamily protein PhnB
MAKARRAAAKKTVKARAKAAKPAARKKAAPARAKAARAGLALSALATSITVDDIATSLSWYTDVLGFTVNQRWEQEGKLLGGELKAGAVVIYLNQDDWQKGRDRVKGEGVRLYMETRQNIDDLAASVKKRGGTLASEPKDEFGARYFNVVDPTGYKITIASAH